MLRDVVLVIDVSTSDVGVAVIPMLGDRVDVSPIIVDTNVTTASGDSALLPVQVHSYAILSCVI